MTTYKLKLTPAGGPVTEKTGLTREQALLAMTELMYGTFDGQVKPVAAEQYERYEQYTAIAA